MKRSSMIRIALATFLPVLGCLQYAEAQLNKMKWTETLMPTDLFGTKVDKSRIKAKGPAVRIYTKYGNFRLQSILSEDDNNPYVVADEKSFGMTDLWQIIAYEKDEKDDYSYIVSAFSGLNIQVPAKAELQPVQLDKHKSKEYRNELWVFEPVPGEDGWYYIRNRNTNQYLNVAHQSDMYYKEDNLLLNRFVIAPKHNPMVLRLQPGKAEMVFDSRSQDQIAERMFVLYSLAKGKRPATNVDVNIVVGGLKLVVDGSSKAGTRLVGDNLSSAKGESAFRFVRIQDNLYKIVLASNPSLCLEIQNGGKGNKTPLVLGNYRGLDHQQFYLYNADASVIRQVVTKDDKCKFRVEDAGQVDWKGR
jgi:hypothetical protein